jgi:YegS/Rv2252/BmrU family lipid kinase
LKKLLFIYNPTAGRGLIKLHLFDIINIFSENGFDTIAHPTQGTLDAFNAAEGAPEDIELIAVSGGDGTLTEVIRGLTSAEKKIPIGYIPAGTMNDFAACHGIPKDMLSAARLAVTGTPTYFDIGRITATGENDTDNSSRFEYFNYVAAFGAFTNVSYETSRQMKNIFGTLAYMIKGFSSVGSIRPFTVTVNHNGETITDDFLFGMAANSTSVGGFKGVTGSDVSLSDGLFECVFVRAVPPSQIAALLSAVMNRDFDSEFLYHFKTSSLSIKSADELGTPIPFTLDGESGGSFPFVQIECIKEGIEVISPWAD